MNTIEHERYLAGLMLHAIEDEPQGDYRTDEILNTANYKQITDVGSKAVFYALAKLFKQGIQADLGTIFTLAKDVNATADLVSEIYGLHYSTTSYEWHLSELRSILAKKVIFNGLKQLSTSFDTSTLEEIKSVLGGLVDEEQFSMEKSDCMQEIKRQLFHTTQKFLSTGSRALDSALGGGFERGQMITLAGRPGMGKTSFALQLAIGRKRMGLPTMVFTMEMQSKDMLERLIAQDLGLKISSVGCAKQHSYDRLVACENSADDMEAKGLELVSRATINLTTIKSHIRSSIHRAKQEGREPIDFVVIDYLGLLGLPKGSDINSSEYAKLTELSRDVKKLALECNIAILILAQLNRGVEGRESSVPKLSDLRGSGAIEQDSNKVLFVYRPNMYDEDAMKANDDFQPAFVIIAKNREGAVGKASYSFNPQIGAWNDQ